MENTQNEKQSAYIPVSEFDTKYYEDVEEKIGILKRSCRKYYKILNDDWMEGVRSQAANSLWKKWHDIIQICFEAVKNKKNIKSLTLIEDQVTEALDMFENVIVNLQNNLGDDLEEWVETQTALDGDTKINDRALGHLLAIMYIAVGDLCRYRIRMSNENNDIHRARAMNAYLTAMELFPQEGKTFNQLAVLTQMSDPRDILSRVYYCPPKPG
eukprot:GHVL01018075.1.p1 GENE.GHVL01018075.1~~GHVL01018075.1.p1  ORF type:complete len:213 (+),score=47.22 GHVL01018075.1:285-923(+)